MKIQEPIPRLLVHAIVRKNIRKNHAQAQQEEETSFHFKLRNPKKNELPINHRHMLFVVKYKPMPYDGLVQIKREVLSKRIAVWVIIPLVMIFFSCGPKNPSLSDLAQRSRKILELQSCEYIYRDVVYHGLNDKFLGMVTTKETRVLFSVNLKVKAGIDLGTGLEISAISPPSGKPWPAVKIAIPAAVVQKVDADENSIHQYFLFEYGLLSDAKIDWISVQQEVEKAKAHAKADAIKRGILDRAWNNSSTVLTNLFHLAGFKTVLIEVAPARKSGEANS